MIKDKNHSIIPKIKDQKMRFTKNKVLIFEKKSRIIFIKTKKGQSHLKINNKIIQINKS